MPARRPTPPRRRFRRRTVRVLVDYQVEGVVCCEYATTLGAGGLFLETEEPLAPGTVLKLRFRLPRDPELFEIEGRVAWQTRCEPPEAGKRTPGMGIEFTDSVACAALARALDRMAED